jgi:ATP-dependent DNA helicase RecQ
MLPEERDAAAQQRPRSKRGALRSQRGGKSTDGKEDLPAIELTPTQKALEQQLRDWRKAEAASAGKPAFIVFGDSVLHAIARLCPTTLAELRTVSGIGPEKADRYGAAILALCRGSESSAPPSSKVSSSSPSSTRSHQDNAAAASSRNVSGSSKKTMENRVVRDSSPAPSPAESATPFTPAQQQLEQRLRDWRSAEAERLGMPQFFVLGTSTLRNIVLAHPQTLAELRTIQGVSLEKLDRFGPGILAVCGAS